MAMPDNIATLNKKKQPRPGEPAVTKPAAPTEKTRKPPRKRRRLITGGIVLAVLALLVVLLPTIVAHTSMLGGIVRRSARLNGSISFQSASLGWFSSTSISGITIRDPQGETVLEAERLTIGRSLLGLMFSSSNLGTLRIEKPRLSATFSREGSNVQTVLARWLGDTGGSSGAGVDASIEIADGEAEIVNQETKQGWQVSNLQLAIGLARQSALPTHVEGSLAYQGEIGQLQPLIDKATCNSGPRLAGRLTGNATIQQADGNISCKAENDIEQLTVDAPSGQSYHDPHVHCATQCSFQTADGVVKVDKTSIGFSGGNFYGFEVGPGQLNTRLAGSTLQADPVQVSCNQGTLNVQPELRMAARPMEFRLAAGTLADHVQLDAAVCRSALKYVVPVIASATQSQGQFSIELDGCRIPLGDLPRAEIGGRVIVHSATMTPGPIVQQLTPMLSTPPAFVSIPRDTVIQFRMTEGRIYHQGLVLAFPEGQVRTFGSVGLDDSLKIMVEFSVPLSWLPKNTVTDAISKQKLQVPMGGTLDAPRIDFAELARVKNQVLANLTRGVLKGGVGELGNQLNRLVKPVH
jgi:hypothetical protein